MSKGPHIDLLAIDLASGKNWLSEGREVDHTKRRQRSYAKHRAANLAARKQETKQQK